MEFILKLKVIFLLLHEKDKYYKALKIANDKYEFGCLNAYVETILIILNNKNRLLMQKKYLPK